MRVINIGRQAGNDVIISDDSASRYHLQIVEFDDGTYHLIDFGSTNGTYVNGLRIEKEVVLEENDFVRIGDTMLPWKSYFAPGFVSQANEDLGNAHPTKEREGMRPRFHPLLQVCLWIVGIGSLLWANYLLFQIGRSVYYLIDFGLSLHWTMALSVMHLAAVVVLGIGALLLLSKRKKAPFFMMVIAAAVLLILLTMDLSQGYYVWLIAVRALGLMLAIGLTCGFLSLKNKKENVSGWKIIFDK